MLFILSKGRAAIRHYACDLCVSVSISRILTVVGVFSVIAQLRRLIVCSTSQPTWVVATKQDTFDDHLHSEKTVSVGVMEFETIAVKI